MFTEFFSLLVLLWVSVFKAAFLISLYLCPDLISTSSRKRWLPWTARGATYLSEWNRFLRSSRLKDCCSVRSLFFFFFLKGFLHHTSLVWLSDSSHSDDLFSLVSRLPFFIFNNKWVFLHCSASLCPLISHRPTLHGRLSFQHSFWVAFASVFSCKTHIFSMEHGTHFSHTQLYIQYKSELN